MATNEFQGIWIPREIWLDARLSALEKIILSQILNLSKNGTGCFASNAYIAEACQCSEHKVSLAVSKLIGLGWLASRGFNGRSRILTGERPADAGRTDPPEETTPAKKEGQPRTEEQAALQKKTASPEKKERPPGRKEQAAPQKSVYTNKETDEPTNKQTLKLTVRKGSEDPFCTEPVPGSMLLPLNDRSFYEVFDVDIDEWQTLYPAADVRQELRNMRGWLDANPTRRKTKSGIRRFINNWLARVQNAAGRAGEAAFAARGQPERVTRAERGKRNLETVKEMLIAEGAFEP